MTTEDKLWIGGGIALAVGGGIYYFVQKASDKQQEYFEEPKAFRERRQNTITHGFVIGTQILHELLR
jgi:hypothetical protein